jgi:hypothetical protein
MRGTVGTAAKTRDSVRTWTEHVTKRLGRISNKARSGWGQTAGQTVPGGCGRPAPGPYAARHNRLLFAYRCRRVASGQRKGRQFSPQK